MKLQTVGKMSSILLFALFMSFNFASAGGWETESNRNGVVVKSKQEAGKDYKTYRGTMTLDVTQDAITKLMCKVGEYPTWMYKTNSAKLKAPKGHGNTIPQNLLDDNDSYEFYIYTVNEGSPLDDRDLSSRIVMKKTATSVALKMSNAPTYVPKTDFVRVTEFNGLWLFELNDDNTIKITYQVYNDPDISLWGVTGRVNKNTKEVVEKTLINMRKKLGR